MNCSSSSDPRNRNIAASFPGQCVAAGRKPTSSKSAASMSRAGGITESTRSVQERGLQSQRRVQKRGTGTRRSEKGHVYEDSLKD